MMDRLAVVCQGWLTCEDHAQPAPAGLGITYHGDRCPRWCAARHPDGAIAPIPHAARGTTVERWRITNARRDGWLLVNLTPEARKPGQEYVDPPPHPDDVDTDRAVEGVRALLRLMGEDPDRPGLMDTPARVVRAYLELADQPGDPDLLLSKVFQDVHSEDSEMIAVPGIAFTSLCEHHLLPFTGTATVAYIPNGGGVVGLSKIPRVVQHYARRPQVQERLTTQIVDSLVDHLHPVGAAVYIESEHSCMALRGVRAQGATMVTSALRGRFLENAATRAEFMSMATRR